MSAAKKYMMQAAFLLGSCGLLHLLGAREHTVVLTGAILGPEALLGLLYVPLWLAAVAVAPVLLFAAVVEALLAGAVSLRRSRGRAAR